MGTGSEGAGSGDDVCPYACVTTVDLASLIKRSPLRWAEAPSWFVRKIVRMLRWISTGLSQHRPTLLVYRQFAEVPISIRISMRDLGREATGTSLRVEDGL